jgi:hypothetical protein
VDIRKQPDLKKLTFLTLFTVISAQFIAPNSFASGESFAGQYPPGPNGFVSFNAIPTFMNNFTNPALIGKTVGSDGLLKSVASCKSMSDSACATGNYIQAYALFDLCVKSNETDCIESISASKSDGTILEVKPVGKFPGPKQQDYSGSSSMGLPPGGQTTLVEIPGAPHAGGITYLAVVNPWGYLDRRSYSGNSEFKMDLRVALYAVKIKGGSYRVSLNGTSVSDYPGSRALWNVNGGGDPNGSCLINDSSSCAEAMEIPEDLRLGIKIRISYVVKNWFGGRLANPDISVSSGNGSQSIIEVSAFPVKVAAVYESIPIGNVPQSLFDFYQDRAKASPGAYEVPELVKFRDNPQGNYSVYTSIGQSQSNMDTFSKWLPLVEDKADALPTLWNFSSITSESQWNDCLKDSKSLAGFVLSNATQYIDGPPTYNAKDNTLDYKVAAPHFTPEGEVFKGSYDLVMSSKVARCFYNFTNAPIGASVSVQTDKGVQNVATTVVNEKNGLLYITAKNFTFSSPTLKIKLTQKKNQKYTITCKKGTVSKPVTGTAPKCPKGFKKVA